MFYTPVCSRTYLLWRTRRPMRTVAEIKPTSQVQLRVTFILFVFWNLLLQLQISCLGIWFVYYNIHHVFLNVMPHANVVIVILLNLWLAAVQNPYRPRQVQSQVFPGWLKYKPEFCKVVRSFKETLLKTALTLKKGQILLFFNCRGIVFILSNLLWLRLKL